MISAFLIGLFVVLMLIGVPVGIAIGLATIVAMLIGGYDLLLIPSAHGGQHAERAADGSHCGSRPWATG